MNQLLSHKINKNFKIRVFQLWNLGISRSLLIERFIRILYTTPFIKMADVGQPEVYLNGKMRRFRRRWWLWEGPTLPKAPNHKPKSKTIT